MRPIKQSNSMKELLKKLKRHDTLVLASGVVAATLMCGAFVYVTTPAISVDAAQEEVRRDSLGVQKKASNQLSEIQKYLEKLDEVVTSSQRLVNDIQTVQKEQKDLVEKTLTEEKTLSKEKNNNTTNNNSKVVEKISGLDKELESIHSEIASTNEQVKKLHENMSKGGSTDPNKDKESFAQITNALSDIKKSCDKSGIDISGIIEQIKSEKGDQTKSQKEVIQNLETIVRSLEKVDTKETLTKLETDLKTTGASYISMLGEVEKNINKTSDNVKKVKDSVNKVGENVQSAVESVNKIDENVHAVENSVNNVGESIQSTRDSVNKVGENVQSTKDSVNKIGESVQSAMNGVNKVGENVQNAMNGMSEIRQSQLGAEGKLGNIDTNVNNVSSNVNNMSTNVNELKEEIKSLKEQLNSKTEQLDTIEKQVNSVFLCSNSNYHELASILFDYTGYKAAEDATFSDLIAAVRDIPLAVIESKNVSIVCHQHTDGSRAINSETCDHMGGCFTTPIKHVHTESCYTYETVYVYYPNFRTYRVTASNGAIGECHVCGKELKREDLSTHTHTTTSLTTAQIARKYTTANGAKKLVCNKTENTVMGYAASCGYKNGQKESATITFPKKFTDPNWAAASLMVSPGGKGIDENIFNFDDFDIDVPVDDSIEENEDNGNADNTDDVEEYDSKQQEENLEDNPSDENGPKSEKEDKKDNTDNASGSSGGQNINSEGQNSNSESGASAEEGSSNDEVGKKFEDGACNDAQDENANSEDKSSGNELTEAQSDKDITGDKNLSTGEDSVNAAVSGDAVKEIHEDAPVSTGNGEG